MKKNYTKDKNIRYNTFIFTQKYFVNFLFDLWSSLNDKRKEEIQKQPTKNALKQIDSG